MLQDNPSPQAASVSIGYANAAQLPRRPGLLTALGIADFLVACLSVLVNVTAIVLCVVIYRLTLPAPAAGPLILPRGRQRRSTLKSRQEAAKALAIDPDEQKVLPVITDPLRDKDPAVRAAALVAWQRERYERPNLIPIDDLVKLLEDPDPQVRFQAACAVKSCRPAMAALGPHTSPLLVAVEREGLEQSRRQGILTDTPAPSVMKQVNDLAPPYDDANPLTGAAIPIATSAPVGASAPFLPTLALCISSLAIPGLVFVIVGVIAKARLASL